MDDTLHNREGPQLNGAFHGGQIIVLRSRVQLSKMLLIQFKIPFTAKNMSHILFLLWWVWKVQRRFVDYLQNLKGLYRFAQLNVLSNVLFVALENEAGSKVNLPKIRIIDFITVEPTFPGLCLVERIIKCFPLIQRPSSLMVYVKK